MKITKLKRHKPTTITSTYKEGLVSIWWYTDDGEFWDFSKPLDDAEEDHGYLQYSTTKNHMNLWRTAVKDHIADVSEQNQIISKGYKSIERGRIVFNIRTQAYEIICSEALVNDPEFRTKCVKYFGLSGNRYDFEALHHYSKQELTGNPAIDSMYYDW